MDRSLEKNAGNSNIFTILKYEHGLFKKAINQIAVCKGGAAALDRVYG
ncbi:MAG: hypothetical protein M3Q26_01400 [Acidobacteriota bacterium]|nr:hypothetical protein [Acidobacteriota bacterium]